MTHGILFSAPMVRAILDGRKTQTRRIIRGASGEFWDHAGWRPHVSNGKIECWETVDGPPMIAPHGPKPRCPYGGPGDELCCKETYRPYTDPVLWDSIQYRADLATMKPVDFPDENAAHRFSDECDENGTTGKWKPSIFMPRRFSRITLKILAVDVQHLQEITEEDAKAEGIGENEFGWGVIHCNKETTSSPNRVYLFGKLWDSINADRAPFSSNPWVWKITFERTKP